MTQTDAKQLSLPNEKKLHEPIDFLGVEFKRAQYSWTTYEKEEFAILQAFSKLDFLFLNEKRTCVFTDHRNLLLLFSPLKTEPSIGKYFISKVLRWAIYLSRLEYTIKHIDGQ